MARFWINIMTSFMAKGAWNGSTSPFLLRVLPSRLEDGPWGEKKAASWSTLDHSTRSQFPTATRFHSSTASSKLFEAGNTSPSLMLLHSSSSFWTSSSFGAARAGGGGAPAGAGEAV